MSRRPGPVWFGRPSVTSSKSATLSTRPSKGQPREQVELAVVFEDIATYRSYKPGAGPRLRPISLLPVRDTTAYIRDEFLIPHTISGDGRKHLQYQVAWTDLPAARLIVDAERIADYVSPRAYEEWCAARAEERIEEERRMEEEENVRAVAEAEAREKRVRLRNGLPKEVPATKTTQVESKKRKRKTKAEREETTRAVTPGSEQKRKAGGPKRNAPSLSTPSKTRLEEFRELDTEVEPETEDLAEDDDDKAIFRQLNGEDPSSVAEESCDSGEGSNVPSGLKPPSKKQRTVSPRPVLSRFLSGIETDSNRSTPFDSSRGATSSPALPPLPQPRATSQANRLGPPSTFPSALPASANYASTPPAIPKKITPIYPPAPPKRSQLSVRDPPTPPQPQPQPSSSSSKTQTQTPTPKPWKPPANMKETPIKPPTNGTSTSSPRTGFTPLSHRSTPWTVAHAVHNASSLTPGQPVQSIEQARVSSTLKSTPKQKPEKPAASVPPPPPANDSIHVKPHDADRDELAESDDVYEVLRLEGLQIRHVRGKPVRYFAVRWKGNWPPDQNPTWEPESNIPRYMTKKYLLAHPAPTPQPPPRPRKGTNGTLDQYLSPPLWSQRKYSSVSEAFEGVEYDAAAAGGNGKDLDLDQAAVKQEDEDGGDTGQDEVLLVTEDPVSSVRPTFSW
ncbi:chromo domain-containing protein [Colletotrichum truncatum]|uniref:Chromo domain-containing protein n=1 Tax=Colletotrichum truncatum TaxID=5467 RepID=A0ACC3Z3A1_COLTU|nr:chromo domain-containing protein [Colletotrichum truncatum]KAF6793118.1 chromo domain-containing protein [Colletotrichum truncatum]